MVLRVLIVEDDANMRLILKRALFGIPNVEVVGEAGNGTEAVGLAAELEPHVIIMDVDLPGKDGVEASREILNISPDVFLVYATGHPEYMAEAFEMYAFDYLVKPYRMERLTQTITRIQKLIESKGKGIQQSREEGSNSVGIKNKIAVKIEGKLTLIDTTKIIYTTRDKRKTVIHTIDGKVTVNESLEGLEKRLAGYNFMRTHRSYLVNLDRIVEIQPLSRNEYLVIFGETKERAYITDEKYRELQIKLNFR
ncbi:two component transcriptional regulator, LytTR family [Desulfitobacterium hafniense DCB-2]|uniref:Stage 0 sporulation protein A homolog n=1 Tax=Desulfitobacterium hafniense (strain DSM 10664 / DCB-2) TaxID=272564 RepID=B8FR15_DESHD|nr:LytTR family DNA-binding domain-containing protein [Desulfitobacterium hafniense]ACL21702.1 two component transcriptional regulator, LytTR family [Desulfitobacterium hafniense DCB-2]